MSRVNHHNLEYIESLYNQYKVSPASVTTEWKFFFDGFELGQDGSFGLSEKELDVYNLIHAYRNYGHFEADLDPLSNTVTPSDQLRLAKFNLTEKDLEQTFQVSGLVGKQGATLKELIAYLKSIYCGKLSIQYADALPEIKNWFIKEFEKNPTAFKLDIAQKKDILQSLTKAESLEKFINTRYVGTKRFSIEGGDVVIPMLDYLVQVSPKNKIEEVAVGMAHRGRINVLANFMEKDVGEFFADFNGPTELESPLEDFDGDVKYHLGYNKLKKTASGATVDCHLAFNPSHLEAVNPVVLGQTRALQRKHKDTKERKKVLPVLIHGDAAFAGQGIVTETFQMAHVRGYNVGGTLHMIIDNQVGFTTNPENGRSSHYASDAAKVTDVPVLHCNGDDAEACVKAMDIAIRYRQEWGRDIVINILCYRRYGHNEGDEPAYTQPLMYDIIRKHPTIRETYAKQMVAGGAIDQAAADSVLTNRMNELQQIYDHAKTNSPKAKIFKFEGAWKSLKKGTTKDMQASVNTTVDPQALARVGAAICELPPGFNLHPKLVKLLETRKAMAAGTEPCDWGMAELLAYGSLLTEGSSVRLTGQDCVRGTFTHRHAGFYDTKTGDICFPLKRLTTEGLASGIAGGASAGGTIVGQPLMDKALTGSGPTNLCIYDSILSEYAVMGFEYGNSITDPSFLTMWEAQFGDFGNGAQIMIDQFIAAGESKWQQMTGLVLLLPHGYEGQGPEHSSARLERFLQLSAQNNMSVVNLTTPAQIFHALRRQVKRDFRKPLIVMSPKSLLRHPRATSFIKDMAQGTFQEVLPEVLLADQTKVEKLVLVSGKLYYELLEYREKNKDVTTALVRIEQISPFPHWVLKDVFKNYPNLKKVIWAQEEPQNMGAFNYVYFKVSELLTQLNLKVSFGYIGRPDRASPATGSVYRHKIEQAEIIEKVFKV